MPPQPPFLGVLSSGICEHVLNAELPSAATASLLLLLPQTKDGTPVRWAWLGTTYEQVCVG